MKNNLKQLMREVRRPTAENMLVEFARRAKNDPRHPAHLPKPPSAYSGYDCVEHAAKLLASLPAGEKVVNEGSCPSGSTYTGYATWDGTMETAQLILKTAWKNSSGAWRGWLRRQADCRQGMWAAELKTG
jgi:hypothetical protein